MKCVICYINLFFKLKFARRKQLRGHISGLKSDSVIIPEAAASGNSYKNFLLFLS